MRRRRSDLGSSGTENVRIGKQFYHGLYDPAFGCVTMPFLQAFAVALLGLGGLVALGNWLSIYLTWRTGRFCSPVPLIGATFLGVGMLLLPSTRPYAWAAVLIDYGTLVALIALPFLVGEFWRTSRFNLLEEYVADHGIKTVHLRLFRKGVFTIEQCFSLQAGECGVISVGTIGKWRREHDRLVLRLDGQCAEFESLPGIEPEGLRQVVGFPNYESDNDLTLAGIELRLRYKRPAS
jgi:hypothetical protein